MSWDDLMSDETEKMRKREKSRKHVRNAQRKSLSVASMMFENCREDLGA